MSPRVEPSAALDGPRIYPPGQHRPWAAGRVVRRIVEAAGKLERQPAIGRPGRIAGTRELVVSGLPYIIVYRNAEHWIDILTVFHTAQRGPDIV